MVVGSMTVETDVVVIGSGPGGYVAAIRAAQLGKDVTLVEKEREIGGTCLNHGCIPTKAIIHSSNYYHIIQHLEEMGIHVKEFSVDMPKMLEWKDNILDKLRKGVQGLCQKHGIEVIRGKAVFQKDNTVHIEGQSDVTAIKYGKAIIATGSVPVEIPAFPFSDPLVMSSRQALQVGEIPKKLIIIGGGYIGTEMGTVYGKLGSEVHIIEMGPHLIPVIEQDLVQVVADRLKHFNVKTYLKCKAKGMENKDGRALVHFEQEGKEFSMDADKVLVVVGRKPNSKGLGLENTKVQLDEKGFIKVDEQMRTADEDIFAIGDIVGQPMLAHKASRQGKIAAEVICGKPSAFDNKVIPIVVFNDPEISSVGLTESQAKEQGLEIEVGRFPFSALGRAQTLNVSAGFVKIVAQKGSGVILGMHAVGPNASDLVCEAALAIEMGATVEDVYSTIHPHPTIPESLIEAAEAVEGQAIHIFQVKK